MNRCTPVSTSVPIWPISTPITLEVIGDPHALTEAARFSGGLVSEVEGSRIGGTVDIVTDDEPQFQAIAGQLPDGVKPVRLRIADAALRHVIDGYAREAGVRNLEKRLAALVRKSVVKLLDDPAARLRIGRAEVEQMLGAPVFTKEKPLRGVGVVTGLAWTGRGRITRVELTLDGGKTWRHTGLADSQQVARIRVHPRDANTVFVAALGHPYGPNAQRGLFKSVDGGATWKKVLGPNADTGAVDVIFEPRNPQVVYAAL